MAGSVSSGREYICGQWRQLRPSRHGHWHCSPHIWKEWEKAIGDLIRELFGKDAVLGHRPDGKPEFTSAREASSGISISHAGDITLLFSANQSVGCDLEKIVGRDSACWEKLLGAEDFMLAKLLANKSQTGFDIAATQVWSLKESQRKVGAAFGQPMSLISRSSDGWTTFSTGAFTATTFCTNIADANAAFAFGFILRSAQ